MPAPRVCVVCVCGACVVRVFVRRADKGVLMRGSEGVCERAQGWGWAHFYKERVGKHGGEVFAVVGGAHS